MDTEPTRKLNTNIYITALDSTVNVNSLFMFAVFVGLAWNPTDPNYTLADPHCFPSHSVAEDLISFQVFSFACFLFSSLIALSIKQALKISRNGSIFGHDEFPSVVMARVNKTTLRVGILAISAGSVCGCAFLMLALVHVVQFKLGTLSCPSKYSIAAIVPLVIFVPIGLLIYVSLVLYAFSR